MLKPQKTYTRLTTDNEISALIEAEIKERLQNNVQISSNLSPVDLQKQLKPSQRTRSLAVWHDHVAILGTGYIMVTVNTIYDTAIFLTAGEYKEKSGHSIGNLQSTIEQPYCSWIPICR